MPPWRCLTLLFRNLNCGTIAALTRNDSHTATSFAFVGREGRGSG
jgi:hypothetical protein